MFLLLLACTSAPPTLPAGGARPDILLISIDTLRADHVGAYGYDRPTTPFLDELAAQGTRFAHARSPSPWTLPTHTTLLTGALPMNHGVVDDGEGLGSEWTTLAEALKQAGYRTGAFVTSFFVGRTHGLDQGMAHFEDFGITSKKRNLAATVDAEEVVTEALAYLEAAPGQAHFLFLHLYDVHYPYAAPSPWNERFDRPETRDDLTYRNYFHHRKKPVSPKQMAHQVAQYDEEIAYVDDQLRRLSDAFRTAGRDVILVVTSDHGEEFGERGSWGHAHTLFPEQLRVPLIVAGPGVASGTIEEAVGTQDIAPTLAELGGTALSNDRIDGISLVSALQGTEPPPRAFLGDTSRFDTNRLGLWRAGVRVEWDVPSDTWSLYADPDESTDLAEARPAEIAVLQQTLSAALPTPWLSQPGQLGSTGVLVIGGAPVGPEITLTQPTEVAVVPVDAQLHHDGQGPWSLSHRPPEQALLKHQGLGTDATDISAEDRARLEALGYIQD